MIKDEWETRKGDRLKEWQKKEDTMKDERDRETKRETEERKGERKTVRLTGTSPEIVLIGLLIDFKPHLHVDWIEVSFYLFLIWTAGNLLSQIQLQVRVEPWN